MERRKKRHLQKKKRNLSKLKFKKIPLTGIFFCWDKFIYFMGLSSVGFLVKALEFFLNGRCDLRQAPLF